MAEPEKRVERIKKHKNGGKNHCKGWERREGIPILYQ